MDQDPFGLTTRDILGPYELHQWEDGVTYYLRGPSNLPNDAYGAIEGSVGKLGWSEDLILAWQNESGSGEGWRIIDIKKEETSGILTQERIDGDPLLKEITIYSAADAWKKLK